MLTLDRSFNVAALRRLSPSVLAVLAVCALAAAPAQATVVVETGEAGQTLATAQVTTGAAGALTGITGSLFASNDADLFLINITAPAAFSASTVSVAGLELDTQLFLFTLAGAPVYGNDDRADGLSLLSALPAGAAFGPVAAGAYYLGISLSGYEPANSNGQLLFSFGLSTDLRSPASGVTPLALSGFDGDGFAPVGAYSIQLSGAAVAAVPEPGTGLMFLVAGALAAAQWRRRGRRAQPVTAPVQA